MKTRCCVNRRYWIEVETGRGYGVTASSEADAIKLAERAAEEFGLPFVVLRIMPDIDVRTLDPGHVLPNMGPPNFPGVWFPRMNLQPPSSLGGRNSGE